MILCSRCETENRETASFCLNCGAKLEKTAPTPQVESLGPDEIEAEPVHPPDQPESLPVEDTDQSLAEPVDVPDLDGIERVLPEEELSSFTVDDLPEAAGSESALVDDEETEVVIKEALVEPDLEVSSPTSEPVALSEDDISGSDRRIGA